MPNHRLLTAAAASALLAGLSAPAFAQAPAAAPAAQAPAAPAAAAAPMGARLVPNGDMASTLRASADFTTLVKALDAVNLASLIQSRPGMTLFAPNNAAFAALPAGQLDTLMADKTALQKLLLHHLINAPVPASKIKGTRGPWPTGGGDKVVLDGGEEGVLKADNARIIQADVAATNGTIHVVDHVLMAGSVPETLPEAAPPEAAAPPPAPEAAKPAAKPAAKKAPAKKKK